MIDSDQEMTPTIYCSDSFLGESKTKQYLFLDPEEPMASCGGLVSTFLLAIFVTQIVEFSHSIASTNVSCIGVEREALLKFKHGLTDPWKRLSSWTGEECCKWEGVECNEKTGHVLKLDLHNPCIEEIDMLEPSYKCRLGGNIVHSLTELKYLKHLDLSINNFSTHKIPMFFASLQKLEYLNLSYAGFNGDIPKQLNNLSKLQYLDLSNDFVLGYLTSNDLDWMSKLSSLTYLHMSGVGLSSAKDCGDLPNQFGDFKELEFLDLSLNSISGSIPSNLGELSSLRELHLNDNKLSGIIPESIGQLSNLKELQVHNNFLYGVLSELHFENLRNLTGLDISSNELILNVSSTWIPPFQVHEIDLSDCKVGPEFPKWLQTQRNITSLMMSNVSISDDIPDWLYNISTNITHLDISSNMLNGQVPQDIGDKMPRLIVLRLWGNNLTGGISSSLCKLNDLTEINLSKNQLSGRLPRCWRASQKVKTFVFGDNKLNGQISKSLCHLQQLQVLSLYRNGFSGVIPNCLSNLQQMTFFDLSHNEFTGRLPPFGEHSQSLAMINLEKNHFVGGIPPQFCQLHYLRVLSLAQNNISGPIPNCIDGFLSMVDSTLYFEDWSYIFGLNVLVNTKGTSQIYGDVISYFFSIDLSVNMLDGQLPEEFTRLVELQNLNLSQNNLSGHIPSNIGDLKQLESLDLSRNKLSGIIPPSISNMDFLSHLNLSFNKLSGRIPSGNHLRTVDDESVYRGNNGLCGAPLSKICPGDEPPSRDGHNGDNSSGDRPSGGNLDIHNWFYAGLGPGFTVGFLGFCSILHFKRSWRVSYFRAMDRAIKEFSVTTMITMLWFKRTIQRRR
ncbi:receptor-like protein EIX2 [Eucalyptus grandis]|uniref:receptor-like protein EIX2 n=1 Tax=Eucalyptus grandis TaxID=71139 RepID=UPI00192E92B1|nr:receptor-like protein EIX2 [Eucalyptus grandis]